MATAAKTTKMVIPDVLTQIWDDENGNFSTMKVVVPVTGGRVLAILIAQSIFLSRWCLGIPAGTFLLWLMGRFL